MKWIRRMIKAIRKKYLKIVAKPVPKPIYRAGKPMPLLKDMHPMARIISDLNLLYAPNPFKFDKDHYLIVHYAASRRSRKARDFFKRFLRKGLNTLFIDGDAILWQQSAGDRCGFHAGKKAIWKGVKINKKSMGIEIANAGLLKRKGRKYVTWFDQEIEPSDVRIVTKAEGYIIPGAYQKYTEGQEEILAEVIAWAIAKGLPKENALGHDDVRPNGQKSDPGGALSMPSREFIEKKALPLVEKYRGLE